MAGWQDAPLAEDTRPSSSSWQSAPLADDSSATDNMGLLQKGKDALAQGAHDAFQGLGDTVNTTIGPGKITGALYAAAHKVAPTDGYTPASEGLNDTTKSLLERAKYLPRALLEGVPGLATDLSLGAATGGAGFMGSMAARSFGPNVIDSAQSHGNDPNHPTTGDYVRGGLGTAATAALAKLGLNPAISDTVGEGAQTLAPMAAGIAKGAASDAASNVLQEGIQKAVVNGQNPLDDPSGLALAGAAGAATGGGIRAVHGLASGEVADVNNNLKFRDFTQRPVEGNALADLYENRSLETPQDQATAIKNVDKVIDDHISHWNSKIKPQLDDLQTANGHQDDTELTLNNAISALKQGQELPNEHLIDLRDRIGDTREGENLLQNLTLKNTQNRLKGLGVLDPGSKSLFGLSREATFGGGIQASPIGDLLNPIGHRGKFIPLSLAGLASPLHLISPGLGFLPHVPFAVAAGLTGAQAAAGLASRAVDKLLGNKDVLGNFVDRYGLKQGAGIPEVPAPSGPKVGKFNTPPVDNSKPAYKQLQEQVRIQRAAQSAVAKASGRAATPPTPQAEAKAVLAKIPKVSKSDTLGNQDQTNTKDPMFHVVNGNIKVSVDKSTVRNYKAFAASVHKRIEDRRDVIQGAKPTVPPAWHEHLDHLEVALSNNAFGSPDVARHKVEAFANSLPVENRVPFMHAMNQSKFWASFTSGSNSNK